MVYVTSLERGGKVALPKGSISKVLVHDGDQRRCSDGVKHVAREEKTFKVLARDTQ